jgi:hypothetical protein
MGKEVGAANSYRGPLEGVHALSTLSHPGDLEKAGCNQCPADRLDRWPLAKWRRMVFPQKPQAPGPAGVSFLACPSWRRVRCAEGVRRPTAPAEWARLSGTLRSSRRSLYGNSSRTLRVDPFIPSVRIALLEVAEERDRAEH